MPIVFQCLHCGSVFAAPDALAGGRARCQACRGAVDVPTVSLNPAVFAQPQLTPVGTTAVSAAALVPVQPQLQPLGPDPLMELLGPRPVPAQSGLPAKWIVGGGVGLACAIITFALVTWAMNRGGSNVVQGPTSANSGDGFIQEPGGPRSNPWQPQAGPTTPSGPTIQSTPPSNTPTVSPFEQVSPPHSSASSTGSGSATTPPSPPTTRRRTPPSSFGGSSSSAAPVPSSTIPSPVEVAGDSSASTPWSIAPDPANPVELKNGDFKVPLTGPQPKIIFPHHQSRFVLAWTGDNSRPECTMYDLKTGLAVGKKIPVFGLDPEKALVSGDGRYVAMTRLDEGRDQHRLRLAAVSFASGEAQPRIEIKCSEFHKALFGASHRVVTAHSVGERYSSNQSRVLTHWDVQTGKALREMDLNELDVNEGARVEFLEISPGGRYVAFPREQEIVLLSLETGTIAGRLPLGGEARGQARLTFSPDGKLLASIEGSSGYRADLRVFDMSSGKLLVDEAIESKSYGVNWHKDELSWLPENRGLFAGGEVLLELTSAREAWNFPRSRGEPRRIFRDGEMITLGADRNKAYLYSAPLPQKQIDTVFAAMRVSGGAAPEAKVVKLKETDLESAPRIDPPTASIAWTYSPDPAPITERTDQREFQVSDEFSHLTAVRFASAAPRVVVQRLPSSGESILEVYDSSGKILQSVGVLREYRLLDLSPSGQSALIGVEKEGKWERLDCISFAKQNHVAAWQPYGKEEPRGQARADLVEWAAFAGEDQIVTNNSQGKLVCWQMPDCQPLYAFQRFGKVLAISGGRKYLLGAEGNNLRVFESQTGRCVGQLPVEHGSLIAKGGAFRADGQEIAVSFAADTDHLVGRWSGTTGKHVDEAPVRGSGSVEYCSNNYLLLEGHRLFDVARRRVVWRYLMGSGGQRVPGSAGSRTWYTAGKTQNDGERHLTSFDVPSDDVKRKTADRRFESQFLLKPGESVRVDVQLGEVGLADMEPLFEQQLREAMESRGFRVSETAGPTLSLIAIERSSGYKIVANLPNGIVNLPGLVEVDEKDVIYHLTLSDAAGHVIWGLDQRVGMAPITMVKVDDPATAVRTRMIDEFKASLGKAAGFIRRDLPRYVFLPTPGAEVSVLAYREERPPPQPVPEQMNLAIGDDEVRPPSTFPTKLSIGRQGRGP